jgi:hypothetical protein
LSERETLASNNSAPYSNRNFFDRVADETLANALGEQSPEVNNSYWEDEEYLLKLDEILNQKRRATVDNDGGVMLGDVIFISSINDSYVQSIGHRR